MFRPTVAKSSLLFGAAIGALLCPASAFAQDAAAPAAQEATEGLNDIVVTAERRPETLLKSPLSVTALTGDSLRTFQTGGDDILSLSARVPGLYAETTTGRIFPRFYIRGLGNIDFYLGASQPVSIIQDDVVLEHVVLKSNPVFDVAQIEVLRGPQGSLFGRNTTAGIIKFDTIKPTQEFQGRGQFSYGSYNTITADVGVGGPIVPDLLAFRVSALYQHRDDWVDNVFTGTSADGTVSPKKDAMGGFDERDIRFQLLFTPGDRFSVNVSAHARDYDGTSTLFHRAALKKGSNSVDAEPRNKVAFDEAMDNPQAYTTYGESVRAAYDFGGVVLTSISAYETTKGYSRGDTDGGAAVNFADTNSGQSQGNVRGLDQFTQEVRLASDGDSPFKWQIGGMYFDSRDVTEFYQRAFFFTTAARNPNNWVRLRNVNTSWAAFGQVSYEILPSLTLTAGGRVTEDKKTTQLLKTADSITGGVTYPASFRRFVKLKDTQPSWDFSALYQVNPDVSLYARVARGFRGPTIQGRSAVFNSDFTTADSETILSWEAGFKSRLFNNMLSLNASAFTYTVNDIQLNGNDSNGNGVLFNADKAKAYGLEAEAEFRPVSNLSLGLGLSLLHSEIKDKRVYAQVCVLNKVVVCTVQDPTITATPFGTPTVFAQIDGNPLPNAPEYTVSFTGRYDVPMGNGGKLFVSTDWNLQGYTNFVLYKTKEFYSKDTFEGGLKLGYSAPGGAYEVAVFGRNITNEKNLKGVIENYMAAVFNEPRVIGISLSGKFR